MLHIFLIGFLFITIPAVGGAAQFYDLNTHNAETATPKSFNPATMTDKQKWLIQKAQEASLRKAKQHLKNKGDKGIMVEFYISPTCKECVTTYIQMIEKLDKKHIKHNVYVVAKNHSEFAEGYQKHALTQLKGKSLNIDFQGAHAFKYGVTKLPAAVLFQHRKKYVYQNDWLKVLKALKLQ